MKLKEIRSIDVLGYYGFRWAVVTDDTEEIIAAFVEKDDANGFIKYKTKRPKQPTEPAESPGHWLDD
jgi:hypothetical protein